MNRFEVFFPQLQTSLMRLRNEVKHGEIKEMERVTTGMCVWRHFLVPHLPYIIQLTRN